MENRTKKRLFGLGMLAALLGISVTALAKIDTFNLVRSSDGGVDCDFYWNNGAYTSLNKVLEEVYTIDADDTKTFSDVESHKTWGTVSKVIEKTDSNGTYYDAIVQSVDNDDNYGGAVLYYVSDQIPDIAVGDFVEITGKITLYSGMAQYNCKKSQSNRASVTRTSNKGYEIVPLLYTGDDIDNYCGETYTEDSLDNSTFTKYLFRGLTSVTLDKVTINSISGNNAVATYTTSSGEEKQFEIFTGKVGTNDRASLNTRIANLVGSTVEISGCFSVYKNTSGRKIQFCVYSVDDFYSYEGHYPSYFYLTQKEFVSYGLNQEIDILAYANYDYDLEVYDVTIVSDNEDVFVTDNEAFTITTVGYGVATGYLKSKSSKSTYTISRFTVRCEKLYLTRFEPVKSSYTYTNQGEYLQIEYICEPAEYASSIQWTSSASNWMYGDINYTGIFSAYYDDEGPITITATLGDYSFDVIIYVNFSAEVAVSSISLSKTDITMEEGSYTTIYANVYPSNATNKNVTWTSNNNSIATVSKYGEIHAIKAGSTIIKATTEDGGYEDYCYVTVTSAGPDQYVIDRSTMSVGTYNTNFGTTTVQGVKTAFYRVGNGSTGFKLYPSADLVGALDNSLPGAFYNDTQLSGITDISITYSSSTPVILRTGLDKNLSNTITLPVSSSTTTKTYHLDSKANYYSVEATTGIAYIDNITIDFDGSLDDVYAAPEQVNDTKRIEPTVYSGELVDGVSYVDVPTEINIVGNTYTVTDTKRYTYYSFSYVQDNYTELDLSEIAITTPEDVSNYYMAFGCVPANYGAKNTITKSESTVGSVSDVVNLFGSAARCVQQFNRTDGYAKAVPYYGTKPIYLEFDIASNNKYTTSARDVTRVVMWATGWKTYGQNIPVATFTDDHYVEFSEYTNYGDWGRYFDTRDSSYSSLRTNRILGTTTTLSPR